MEQEKRIVISHTRSICPVCGKQLPAQRVRHGDDIFLEKSCPEHGNFSTVIWRGRMSISSWTCRTEPLGDDYNPQCPYDCGLCHSHISDTCCVLYEVTRRCNLRCSFCFAEGGEGEDIALDKIKRDISALTRPGKTFLQLSGGEPTVRDDLPEIVAHAKSAGCKYLQLNSNGIRLAEDEAFVAALAEAGLSFVFMQFDGTNDDIYRQLRGKPLLATKEQAIANCAKYHIGVTLVPTLVPGVNTDDIGNIVRFGISRSPVVRGVHFQPVSYFGRYPAPPADEDRYTLSELVADLGRQTGGLVNITNIAPSHCDHPLCGFHSSFIAMEDGRFIALTKPDSEGCCCGVTTAEQNREYIGRRWSRPQDEAGSSTADEPASKSQHVEGEPDDLDEFLRQAKTRAFTVTAMAFQDAYNLDIERIRRCSLHVYEDGKFMPFCARYLTLGEVE